MTDLIERLRGDVQFLASQPLGMNMMQWCEFSNRWLEAADALEALTAENERLREALESVLAHRYGEWCDIARAALAGKAEQ